MQQAIIWTNDGLFTEVYMRHSVSMSETQIIIEPRWINFTGAFSGHMVNNMVKAQEFARMNVIYDDLSASIYDIKRELRTMDTGAAMHMYAACILKMLLLFT